MTVHCWWDQTDAETTAVLYIYNPRKSFRQSVCVGACQEVLAEVKKLNEDPQVKIL